MTPFEARAKAAELAKAKNATAVPPEPTTDKPDSDGSPVRAATLIKAISAGWQTALAAGGAIAGTVVAHDLTKNLGKGSLTGTDHRVAMVSIAAFGIGIVMVVVVPVLITPSTRATLSTAAHKHRKAQKQSDSASTDKDKLWKKEPTIGRDVLLGHANVAEFYDALTDQLQAARVLHEQGALSAQRRAHLEWYVAQRDQAQLHVAADQVSRGSRRALPVATIGVVLVLGGFANTTWITNQGIRRAEVADAQTKVANAREDKKLDAELADASAAKELDARLAQQNSGPPSLLTLPTQVRVTFPDSDSAAESLGIDSSALTETCWKQGRTGTAYELSSSGDDKDRFVQVALGPIAGCSGAAISASPSWLTAPSAENSTDKPAEADKPAENSTDEPAADEEE